uniref:Uncharacterized protein n=1 Tax=Anguilla anguilla TaxID=7936 RepID=A0A0E9UR44_ANGAN
MPFLTGVKSERSSTNHGAQRQQLLESGQWSFKKNHTSLMPHRAPGDTCTNHRWCWLVCCD